MLPAHISRKSRSASYFKSLETETQTALFCSRLKFSEIIPATDRPFPTTAPPRLKNRHVNRQVIFAGVADKHR